jgi:SAM-dependent methyltransferase
VTRPRRTSVGKTLGKSVRSGTPYSTRQLKAIAARWDARASDWDQSLTDPACHLNEDDAYPRFLRELRTVLAERANFCRVEGVVDAGCGTGLILAEVAPYFSWGIGIDISPKMIQEAKRKRIPKARFIIGDCFELSRICAPAGAIVSRGVLLSHYGPTQAAAFLAEARRTLVPGGFVICDFLNRAAQHKFQHRPREKTFFTASAACRLAQGVGFATTQILGEPASRVLILCLEG